MILSKKLITELIGQYPTHSDKWLLARAIERETAEACAKIVEHATARSRFIQAACNGANSAECEIAKAIRGASK
jgi:hypothetical protein